MFKEITDADERGQVGIGTLIVFIAMVLVAAIAAGVLVNTAGFLQSSAQDTGQSASGEVTDRVQVVNGHGIYTEYSSHPVGGNSSGVSEMKLTIRRASGADDVNLNTTTIKYTTDSNVTTLEQNATAPDAGNFTVTELNDDDNSLSEDNVLNADTDRAEITINATAIGQAALGTNTDVRLEITTASGGTTQVEFTTPESYAGKSDGEAVRIEV